MKEIIANLQTKSQEIKAYMDDCGTKPYSKEEIDSLMRYLNSEFSYMQRQINSLHDSLYQHTGSGHLPKIKSTGQLKKVLEVLGLSDDYVVVPEVVYAMEDGAPSRLKLEISKK